MNPLTPPTMIGSHQHDPFILLDTTGALCIQTRDGTMYTLPHAVTLALYQFFQGDRATALLTHLLYHQLRRDAAERIELATVLDLIDAHLSLPPAPNESVREELAICTDRLNPERLGTPYGTQYLCGAGDDEVEVYFDNDGSAPEVYMLGRDPIPLTELTQALPNLITLLTDTRVQQHSQQDAVTR